MSATLPRRTLARGLAWTVPAIALAGAAPVFATSVDPVTDATLIKASGTRYTLTVNIAAGFLNCVVTITSVTSTVTSGSRAGQQIPWTLPTVRSFTVTSNSSANYRLNGFGIPTGGGTLGDFTVNFTLNCGGVITTGSHTGPFTP